MQILTKEDCSENIIVVVRVKPPGEDETAEKHCITTDKNSITLDTRTDLKTFCFDYIAGEKVSQEEIFEITGRPLADACIKGTSFSRFLRLQCNGIRIWTDWSWQNVHDPRSDCRTDPF